MQSCLVALKMYFAISPKQKELVDHEILFDPSVYARVDAHIAKAAPFAQPILTHIRELVHKTLPNVEEAIKCSMPFSTDIPGNEYLPDNEIASVAFWLSQTMVLPKQLSVVRNP